MISDYSAPIRDVYSRCVDLLIQNIARHFPFEALTGNYSFQWETMKLAELGQLRRENLAIIARTIGDPSGMTEIALEKAMTDALKRGKPELLEAVKAGMLEAGAPAEMSASMQGILRYYSGQAAIQANLVNTVMTGVLAAISKSVAESAQAGKAALDNTLLGRVQSIAGIGYAYPSTGAVSAGIMRGSALLAYGSAGTPGEAGTTIYAPQTINFNREMQAPDEIARSIRRQTTYGLAGARR